jgi:hypothetical protein
MRDFVLQTTAPDDLASALKMEAARLRVTLLEVYAEAFEGFFRHRMALKKAGKTVPYLVAPKSANPLNVRVPLPIAMKAQGIADEDDMTVRALTYTALADYAMKLALIDSIGPLQSGMLSDETREHSRSSSSTEPRWQKTGPRVIEKKDERLPSPRPSTAPYVPRANRGKWKSK